MCKCVSVCAINGIGARVRVRIRVGFREESEKLAKTKNLVNWIIRVCNILHVT